MALYEPAAGAISPTPGIAVVEANCLLALEDCSAKPLMAFQNLPRITRTALEDCQPSNATDIEAECAGILHVKQGLHVFNMKFVTLSRMDLASPHAFFLVRPQVLPTHTSSCRSQSDDAFVACSRNTFTTSLFRGSLMLVRDAEVVEAVGSPAFVKIKPPNG